TKTGALQKFTNDPKNERSLSNNALAAIDKDKHGYLWVGTRNGLNRFDPRSRIFTRYLSIANDSSTISNNRIINIKADGQILWVAIRKRISGSRPAQVSKG